MNTLKKLKRRAQESQQGKPVSLALPVVETPQYRAGIYGAWALGRSPDAVFTTGYFTGWAHEPAYFGLLKDGQIWMTTSRLERESHSIHLKHARGKVVVCGVGMGMFLYNLATRSEVEQIVAVDIDSDVIRLMQEVSGFSTWRGREKIRFVEKDALQLTGEDVGIPERRIDYLYVDIWPSLGTPQAVEETVTIASHVPAATVGWWGQEIDFAHWWKTQQHPPGRAMPSGTDVAKFGLQRGLTIQEPTDAYGAACVAVGNTFALANSKPTEGQGLFGGRVVRNRGSRQANLPGQPFDSHAK